MKTLEKNNEEPKTKQNKKDGKNKKNRLSAQTAHSWVSGSVQLGEQDVDGEASEAPEEKPSEKR